MIYTWYVILVEKTSSTPCEIMGMKVSIVKFPEIYNHFDWLDWLESIIFSWNILSTSNMCLGIGSMTSLEDEDDASGYATINDLNTAVVTKEYASREPEIPTEVKTVAAKT